MTQGKDDEPMVSATVIQERLGIPRGTVLRLAKEGRIPAHEVTQPWQLRRQWRFKLSEVQAALERPRDSE